MKVNPARILEIYDYIEAYRLLNGYAPSQAEIAAAIGVTKGYVSRCLKVMETSGMIARVGGRRDIALKSRDLPSELTEK